MRKLAVVLASAAAAVLLTSCGQSDDTSDSDSSAGSDQTSASSSPSDQGDQGDQGECSYAPTGGAARKVDLPPSTPAPAKSLEVTTNRGAFRVTLNDATTPCTANSFTSLAKQGYFDKTKCHRLTTQGIFVLQCGDPTAQGTGGPGYSFADELNGQETYPAGTLAMANSGPNTNGSQFFIVYANTALPPNYTVFGKVDAAGLRIVKKIAAEGTANGSGDGPPKRDVVVESVRR
jgi:peptidyl-prolyl cis-trans isomerase B (cyclophilin B)